MKIEQRHMTTNCSGRFSLACALHANAHAPYIPGKARPVPDRACVVATRRTWPAPAVTLFNSIKLHLDLASREIAHLHAFY